MTVAKRIKDKRIELGYTQDDLAKKIGTTRNAVAALEYKGGDQIKLSTVKKYAKALNVSTNYLMGWKEKEETTDLIADEKLVIDLIKSKDQQEFLKLFNLLNEEHQALILDQIDFYINRQNENKG